MTDGVDVGEGAGDGFRIDDLRRACELLLVEAERRFGAVFNCPGDYYWKVDVRSAYSMADDTEGQIDAGSLTDDIEELANILSRDPGELYLWHDLVHVIGLLGAVASRDLPRAGR